ncbi:MAG: BT_3928 family protein [Bacteroidia bacterium]
MTIIIRLLTGALFIFSGFIKANDPMGFGYKLEEYFGVFGISSLNPAATFIATFICVFEMGLGLALLIGWRRMLTLWLLLLMIVFFTFLTFYSAWFNVVTDCGCFGDFLKLTPWESFTKDMVLLLMIGWLFFRRNHFAAIWSNDIRNRLMIAFVASSTLFSAYTWAYLPVIDFRPYAIGKNIMEGMQIPEGAPLDEYEDSWFYRVNGEVQKFSTDQAPWNIEGAEFVDRKTVLVKKGYSAPVHDFTIFDLEGNDYTEDFLMAEKCIFIVAYDLKKSRKDAWKELESIVKWADVQQLRVAFLTASTTTQIQDFQQTYGTTWPLYITDGTTLKTIVRSNPGLVALKSGTVINKWPARSLPSLQQLDQLFNE